MAPKQCAGGAAGHSGKEYVRGLWQAGLPESAIRQQLKDDGYKTDRISQLIKATRPAMASVAPAAAASGSADRPPAPPDAKAGTSSNQV